MRSGPARRCASYCTWSSRSRTMVLESADDQCRIPVTRGNFDNSCAVAGEFEELASGIASEDAFSALAEFVTRFVAACFASVTGVLDAILSVRIIALLNCAVFSFHQTPATNAVATTMATNRISA